MAAPPPARPPLDPDALARARAARPRRQVFRPRFTISLFYVAAFVILYGLLFALPDLVAGARELPPGQAQLTPEELARAREIGQDALQGRLLYAVAAALATFGLLTWRGWLPGVGSRE